MHLHLRLHLKYEYGHYYIIGMNSELTTLIFYFNSNFIQMVATKIIKSGGAEPDEFEKTVSQALLELELNSELKPQLRDLYITRARELEFATKKVKIVLKN